MSFGPFGYTRYTQKFASAVFRAGGTITWSQLFLVDNLAYWLWLWNGDTTKWGLPLEETFEFIYPFVGGNAVAHSFNLVDPNRGRITWVGGVTHTSGGVTGNGTNGYGKTGIKLAGPSDLDTYVIFGLHNNTSGSAGDNFYDMGNMHVDFQGSFCRINTRFATGGNAQFINGQLAAPTAQIGGAVGNHWGFYICLRNAPNSFVAWRSTGAGAAIATVGTNTSTNSMASPEGQWCVLTGGDGTETYSNHTMMAAFLTKAAQGTSPMSYVYVYTEPKMAEIANDFYTFNYYLGRSAM
jgi:hypothetical protein